MAERGDPRRTRGGCSHDVRHDQLVSTDASRFHVGKWSDEEDKVKDEKEEVEAKEEEPKD